MSASEVRFVLLHPSTWFKQPLILYVANWKSLEHPQCKIWAMDCLMPLRNYTLLHLAEVYLALETNLAYLFRYKQ
jgi:hypothetical protein